MTGSLLTVSRFPAPNAIAAWTSALQPSYCPGAESHILPGPHGGDCLSAPVFTGNVGFVPRVDLEDPSREEKYVRTAIVLREVLI